MALAFLCLVHQGLARMEMLGPSRSCCMQSDSRSLS